MPESKSFLRTVRPPYFDAFYFRDEAAQSMASSINQPFFKIIFYLEGDTYYTIQDQRYDLIPGDILITPPFLPHCAYSPNNQVYCRLVLWFTTDLLDSVDTNGELRLFFERISFSKNGAKFRFAHSYQNEIFQQAFHLASEREYAKPFADTVAHSLASLILVGIYRAATSSRDEDADDPQTNLLIQSVVSYINENLHKDLSLDMIEEKFYISKFHLERLFKKRMGITVHSYIIQRRLTLARQKLYDGAAPGSIYKSCGFKNYSTFYRAFQKMYHTTPKLFSEQAATIMPADGNHSWNAWGHLEDKGL